MSLHYKPAVASDAQRLVKPSTKLRNLLSDIYQKKVSEYDTLHAELSDAEDVKLHDTHLSEENDEKIVRLSELRDEVNALKAQLDILTQV